jgi:hypothetical protein
MNLIDFFNAKNQSLSEWFFRGFVLGVIAGVIGAVIAIVNAFS